MYVCVCEFSILSMYRTYTVHVLYVSFVSFE